MFSGMTETVSTTPIVQQGLKAVLQADSPPKTPS